MSFLHLKSYVNSIGLHRKNGLQGELPIQARAINVLNIFRFLLSLIFIGLYLFISKEVWWNSDTAPTFFNISIAYFLFSVVALLISPLIAISHRFVLPTQIVIDIVCITLLMHTAGGIQSGLGLLLIITIVIASLVSNGRLALFYAAIASISLLAEQSYQIVVENLSVASYTQPAILSLSCFATAWLAYSLAKRMQASEALASARGIDIKNLSQINALITQEMHDGVIVVDERFNVRHHNLQAQSLLTLPKSGTENISLALCAPEIYAILSAWIAVEKSSDYSVISMGNHELKLRCTPISQQRSKGAVVFIQDLSQLQSKAQQAKLAALGRLTANIAHEIRNPLSAISHANQLLQEDAHASASTARILQIVEDNIGRIDQIIKDVLELNRRDRTQQAPIELSAFLADFHAQFCAVEKVSPAHFKLLPLRQNQVIAFDQRHLTQILWNLSKNGWQHSQKQLGSLSVEVLEVGVTGLDIQVVDDGSGVAEQDRARLFEPFFTTKSTGNGLGLYISRELAEANGASLQYQALPIGSAFIVKLKKSDTINFSQSSNIEN